VKHVAFVSVQESGIALAVFVGRGNRMWCVCWFSWQRHCNAATVTSETAVLAETPLHCGGMMLSEEEAKCGACGCCLGRDTVGKLQSCNSVFRVSRVGTDDTAMWEKK